MMFGKTLFVLCLAVAAVAGGAAGGRPAAAGAMAGDAGPGLAAGEFLGEWTLESGGEMGRGDEFKSFYHGTLTFVEENGHLRGVFNLGRPERLTEVTIAGGEVAFTRSLSLFAQYYKGRIVSAGRIEGTFDHKGTKYRWWATRAGGAAPRPTPAVPASPAADFLAGKWGHVYDATIDGRIVPAEAPDPVDVTPVGGNRFTARYSSGLYGTYTGELLAEGDRTRVRMHYADPGHNYTAEFTGVLLDRDTVQGSYTGSRGDRYEFRWTRVKPLPIPPRPAPPTPASGQLILSRMVSPASGAQTVGDAGGVRITIPGGLLKSPAEVRIVKLPADSLPAPHAEEILSVYDISVGELAELRQEVILELPYDPAMLPADIPAGDVLSAALWDRESSSWNHLLTELDATRRVVIARTLHLSPNAVVAPRNVKKLQKKIPAEQFKLNAPSGLAGVNTRFYLNEDTRILVDRFFRMTWTKADEDAKVSYENGDPEVTKLGFRWREIPDQIEDVWVALHKARSAYAGAAGGDGSRLDCPLMQNVALDDSYSQSRTGIVPFYDIGLAYKTDFKFARSDTAHEFFHALQHRYYSSNDMKLVKWWIEATADYAAEWLAFSGQNNLMGGEHVSVKYLETPLTYATTQFITSDDADYRDHEYTTAFFLQFLVQRQGVDFVRLWNALAKAAVTAGTLTGDDARANLDAYLKRVHNKSLAEMYHLFARWWAFDPASPVRTRKGKTVDDVAVSAEGWTMKPPLEERTFDQLKLDGGHTAKVVVLNLLGGDYDISVPELPADTCADLFCSTGPDTVGPPTELYGSKIPARGRCYILAVNNGSSSQTIRIRAETAGKPAPAAAGGFLGLSVDLQGSAVKTIQNDFGPEMNCQDERRPEELSFQESGMPVTRTGADSFTVEFHSNNVGGTQRRTIKVSGRFSPPSKTAPAGQSLLDVTVEIKDICADFWSAETDTKQSWVNDFTLRVAAAPRKSDPAGRRKYLATLGPGTDVKYVGQFTATGRGWVTDKTGNTEKGDLVKKITAGEYQVDSGHLWITFSDRP